MACDRGTGQSTLLECSSCQVSGWIVHLGVVVRENGGVFYVDEAEQEGEDSLVPVKCERKIN